MITSIDYQGLMAATTIYTHSEMAVRQHHLSATGASTTEENARH